MGNVLWAEFGPVNNGHCLLFVADIQDKTAVTHLYRNNALCRNQEAGVSHTESKTLMGLEHTTSTESYLRGSYNVLAGLPLVGWKTPQSFACNRVAPSTTVPWALRCEIFPELERVLALAKATNTICKDKHNNKGDVSAVAFLETLVYLRTVYLQDAAHLAYRFNTFPAYQHRVFADPQLSAIFTSYSVQEITACGERDQFYATKMAGPLGEHLVQQGAAINQVLEMMTNGGNSGEFVSPIGFNSDSSGDLVGPLPPIGLAFNSGSSSNDDLVLPPGPLGIGFNNSSSSSLISLPPFNPFNSSSSLISPPPFNFSFNSNNGGSTPSLPVFPDKIANLVFFYNRWNSEWRQMMEAHLKVYRRFQWSKCFDFAVKGKGAIMSKLWHAYKGFLTFVDSVDAPRRSKALGVLVEFAGRNELSHTALVKYVFFHMVHPENVIEMRYASLSPLLFSALTSAGFAVKQARSKQDHSAKKRKL